MGSSLGEIRADIDTRMRLKDSGIWSQDKPVSGGIQYKEPDVTDGLGFEFESVLSRFRIALGSARWTVKYSFGPRKCVFEGI